MSNDLISRKALLEGIDDLIAGIAFTSPYQDELHCLIDGMERVRDRVAEAPTLTLDDLRPKGRWLNVRLFTTGDGRVRLGDCSCCGSAEKLRDFCPSCGADMRGGGSDA